MNELKFNDILQLEIVGKFTIFAVVVKVEQDIVRLEVNHEHYQNAKQIVLGDIVYANVHTQTGTRQMESVVLKTFDENHCIEIKNTPTWTNIHKRDFVRVDDSFEFKFKAGLFSKYKATATNISAGGIAFRTEKPIFHAGEKITCLFGPGIFGLAPLTCKAKIVKAVNRHCAAQFILLSEADEDRIAKRVFKILSDKQNL